jgi:hypothetical protein
MRDVTEQLLRDSSEGPGPYTKLVAEAAYGLPPVVPTGKTDYKIGTGGTVVLAAAVVAIVGIGVIGTKMKVRFW